MSAADTRLSTGSEEVRDMLGSIPELWGKAGPVNLPDAAFNAIAAKFTKALEDARGVAQAEPEPYAWAVERPTDSSFPRLYRTKREADAMVQFVNVNPPAMARPLYAAPQPASNAYTAKEPVDWQEMPETRRLLSTITQGVECTFDDSQVTIFISDESDPSVGLDGGLHLSLSSNYEVIPLSLLKDIKSALGDNWERCVASWQETYAPSVSSTEGK